MRPGRTARPPRHFGGNAPEALCPVSLQLGWKGSGRRQHGPGGRRERVEARLIAVFEAEDAIEFGFASRRHLQPISDLGPGLVIGLLV